MECAVQKQVGSYYTPGEVVESLVRWAVRSPDDRLLDPSCGDGRFLAAHSNSVGVEHQATAARLAHRQAPTSPIHEGDFFAWAAATHERFSCAAGNPPFIRYQRFGGEVRRRAIRLCAAHGAKFTALASSWAPFIVAASTLLRPGGRMAFVVPAEIGHAPYARPVLQHLAANFDWVQVIAIRRKLFPELSEDCWLLYCSGFGGRADELAFSTIDRFRFAETPPQADLLVPLNDWRGWGCRLRPFLLPAETRSSYRAWAEAPDCPHLKHVARVGIGYVTGANDFFHLRPSEAERSRIPGSLLHPAVRSGRYLVGSAITDSTVEGWRRQDEPMLLLRLKRSDHLSQAVKNYLDSAQGKTARETYKCRNRRPWYVVPDVRVPDAFLSYMIGTSPALVANRARCVATNSVHVVRLNGSMSLAELQARWHQPLTALSCEVEGHPLGGGMLKLEPREAGNVLLAPRVARARKEEARIGEGIEIMRTWRHYGQDAARLPLD